MKCPSLRKLLNNVFKRKIKQILFEILASEDCYIDLPVIVQKVKFWSLQLFVIIVVNYQITCNTVSLLVVHSNRCQFQSPQSSCCFHLYLVVPSYPGSEAWGQVSAFIFCLRLFTNRRLVSTAHASLMHAYDTWNSQKLSSCKATSSDAMISRAMKSLTNEHIVRGRPTLKVVKRFRKGSVCKAYERSTIYERTF